MACRHTVGLEPRILIVFPYPSQRPRAPPPPPGLRLRECENHSEDFSQPVPRGLRKPKGVGVVGKADLGLSSLAQGGRTRTPFGLSWLHPKQQPFGFHRMRPEPEPHLKVDEQDEVYHPFFPSTLSTLVFQFIDIELFKKSIPFASMLVWK